MSFEIRKTLFELIGILGKLHRSNYSVLIKKISEGILKYFYKRRSPLGENYSQYAIEKGCTNCAGKKFVQNPSRALAKMAIVLKSPCSASKGLVLLKYSYFFPFFLKIFNVTEIQKSYYLCLEPSWSGYFTENILCYASLEDPVFVQTNEPTDASFLLNCTRNLKPISVAANYWVDYRNYVPSGKVLKDIDIVMVSSWAKFKRHEKVFEVISRINKKGRNLKLSLVGYPIDLTKDDIWRMAKRNGISKQVEIFDRISPPEVADQYRRSKINLLWSKKEGVNRSIIEGMFCDVPCIIPEGFNYGHKYHYINEKTGKFVSEKKLEVEILDMLDNIDTFFPREYVEKAVTWDNAVKIMRTEIDSYLKSYGLEFSGKIRGKVNNLNGMEYWDSYDVHNFSDDYDFLLSQVR